MILIHKHTHTRARAKCLLNAATLDKKSFHFHAMIHVQVVHSLWQTYKCTKFNIISSHSGLLRLKWYKLDLKCKKRHFLG